MGVACVPGRHGCCIERTDMWRSVHPSGSGPKDVQQIVMSLVNCVCQGVGPFT